MNIKEFGIVNKDVKHLVIIDFKDGIDKSFVNTVLVNEGLVKLSDNIFGTNNPVDAVMVLKSFPTLQDYIDDINLLRVTDIMDLKRCLA